MNVKRGAELAESVTQCKRLHVEGCKRVCKTHPGVHQSSDLDPPTQQVDLFLKRVGVCAGVHAASDTHCCGSKGTSGVLKVGRDWQGLTEDTWRCCAELNVLLQWYSNQISQLPLAAHCSWPHAAKAATLEQVAKACQHSKLPNTWVQLQMVSHLMHTILHDHENLAISKSTIALHRGCPAWLQSWCSRWGFTEEYISILTLEAYAVQTSSTARDFCGRPLEPCAPQLTPVNLLYVPYIF